MLIQEETISVLNKILNQRARVRKGTDAVYFCPVCKHRKRKLEINLLSGKYNCWVCNFSGLNLKSLFKKLKAPKECYRIFLDNKPSYSVNYDINKLKEVFSKNEKPSEILKLPDEYISLTDSITQSIECKNAVCYLLKRNVSYQDIIRYQIGYCESGIYRNRIIIPSYDKNQNLNFFVGRSFYDKVNLRYNNCEFSKDVVGFESMIDFKQELTLVEGSFDAISVKYNCVPLFGKTMSRKLKEAILINRPPVVNVILDSDAFKNSLKIVEFLIKNDIPVKMVNLGEHDSSEIGFENTWDIIKKTPTLSFETFFKIKLNNEYCRN